MSSRSVQFEFVTGIKRSIFRSARLLGSWDATGRYSDQWTETPMLEKVGSDGSPVFRTRISLDARDASKTFRWGVVLDGPQGSNFWGIPTERQDIASSDRYREFHLDSNSPGQVERYYFSWGRRLGANKRFVDDNARPGIRFAVWAPNAKKVEVVFADPARGYIADDGTGIDPMMPIVGLSRDHDGIWEGSPPGEFEAFKSLPYMYRIANAQGDTIYRTDIFSRSQIGKGSINPAKSSWMGTAETLDGTVSCSIVIDPDVVRRGFESCPSGERPDLIPVEQFWASEFTPGLPLPTRLEDLVIYELHVGSLGFGKAAPGNLGDAVRFLDYLVDLGVNAVEMLPMAEFSGSISMGYGDTHHLCIESSAGGRDKYRHFVRECHRRGIAVIQDVVYNHYDNEAARAEWQYDSTAPEQNIYYWYEGRPSDYATPEGGYLDNGSSGYTPRFYEEAVRQQFISGAVFLVEEMHIDGFRVDLTQAMHRDNRLHADGRSIASANIFGQKLLREWSRTLRMIRPSVILIAEDHTEWDAVTKLPAQGGLGFGAKWEIAFYHDLIGDSDMAGDRARLLKHAGFGGDDPLHIGLFASALYGSRYNQIIFHESHDEAGNASGTARTAVTAVNGAPLIDATRFVAEARLRTCAGLSLLSAGTPMFFMGEEIGAQKPYTYNNFLQSREDFLGERNLSGKRLFRFYQDLITLRRRFQSLRTRNIDILHNSDLNRMIAFKRWSADEQLIIVASMNNNPFASGYVIEKDAQAIPDADWKEIFNSDAEVYGGANIGNRSALVTSNQARLTVIVPANGFVVFAKQ